MSSEGGNGSRGIVVAGSLRSSFGEHEEEDNESSSSSSDDESNDYEDGKKQMEEDIELNFDGGDEFDEDDDDDDEILETFGDAPPPSSSARKPKSKAKATSQSSTATQFNSTATATATVTGGGIMGSKQPSEIIEADDAFGSRLHTAMAQSVNSVLGAKSSITQTTAAQSSEFSNQEEVFGFTYKPFKKPSQHSKLSSPDDEFEKEPLKIFSPNSTASPATNSLSNRTATKTNDKTNYNYDGGNNSNNSNNSNNNNEADDDDDDDEFDFSDDDNGGKKEEALKSLEAQLSHARSKARESDHVAEIDSTIEMQLQKQKQIVSPSPSSPSSKNIQEEESNYEKIDLKSASRKALSEITEVYSSGSGNIEVRLLDMDPDQVSSTKALPPLMTSSKELNVIEEGDEEEEEEEERIEIIKKNVEYDNNIKIASEWDNLDNLDSAAQSTSATIRESFAFDYSYNGVLSYLSSKDLTVHKSKIVTKDTSSKPSTFTSWFSSNEELKFDGYINQLELPFLVAHVDYDPSNEVDVGILRHMYLLLYPDTENSSFSLPPYGKHWDRIGFQGDNPGTDINRSMKMFAVLQTLHFIEHARNLATQAHRLSINTEIVSSLKMDNSWPFFCTSIGFTKEAIQALRRGDLNAKCNKRKDVLSVLHDFHHGCFLEFATLLKGSPNVHHAVHLAKIREVSQKNPASILKNYKSFSASVDNSLASIKAIIGKSGSSSYSGSNSSSSSSNSSNSSLTSKSTSSSGGGADDFKFDDLDKMNDDSSTSSSGPSSSSSLLTSVGIGKASKFIAKE